jgi:preprotein translocase subunit SecF
MSFDLIEKLDSYIKNHSNKQLVAMPSILFIIAISIIASTFVITGTPLSLGMEFEGGTMITIIHDSADEILDTYSEKYPIEDVRETGDSVIIMFGPMERELRTEIIEYFSGAYQVKEIKDIGAEFGRDLQFQALKAVSISFIGMGVIVLLIFKSIVPSGTVVLAALSNISIAAAFMNVFGIDLTLGTVAALLMLIGYSVDSNILLANRLLKRRGDVEEKISKAMHTGVIMTTTTLAALFVMFIISSYSHLIIPGLPKMALFSDISVVLIFGLVADIINTWMLNTGILRWYVQKPTTKRRRA